MKTSKRYITRIVIPVVAAIFIAVTGNMIYRAIVADKNPPKAQVNKEPISTDVDQALASPYSEALVIERVNYLKRSLDTVKATAPDTSELNQLHREAKAEIDKLREANKETYDELLIAARQALQNYSEEVGREAESKPQS